MMNTSMSITMTMKMNTIMIMDITTMITTTIIITTTEKAKPKNMASAQWFITTADLSTLKNLTVW